jgi:Domain of unknown function (DUF4326)
MSVTGGHRTTVANIGDGETPFDVYIGRQRGPAMWRGGYHLPRSDWANPFKVGKDGSREVVVEKYKRYLLTERPDLVARLPELKGKALGCWCAPDLCHGHVLARLADGAA